MKITLTINQQPQTLDVDPDMPLLWALRDHVKLTGTKYGCGMGLCGACTVHLDGKPVRACSTPVSTVKGAKITTIEGLSKDGNHPVQRAWRDESVPQCGYCQSGQMMTAAALLREKPSPTAEETRAAMAGNICRCGTYDRIGRAVERAALYARDAKATTK